MRKPSLRSRVALLARIFGAVRMVRGELGRARQTLRVTRDAASAADVTRRNARGATRFWSGRCGLGANRWHRNRYSRFVAHKAFVVAKAIVFVELWNLGYPRGAAAVTA